LNVHRYKTVNSYKSLVSQRALHLQFNLHFDFWQNKQSTYIPLAFKDPPILEGVFPYRPPIQKEILEILVDSPYEIFITGEIDYEHALLIAFGFDPLLVSIPNIQNHLHSRESYAINQYANRCFLNEKLTTGLPVLIHAINHNLIELTREISDSIFCYEIDSLYQQFNDYNDTVKKERELDPNYLNEYYGFYEDVYLPIAEIISGITDHNLFYNDCLPEYHDELSKGAKSIYYEMFRSIEKSIPQFLCVEGEMHYEISWQCDFTQNSIVTSLYDSWYSGVSVESVYNIATLTFDEKFKHTLDAHGNQHDIAISQKVYDYIWELT
jgi:hypothetical protein